MIDNLYLITDVAHIKLGEQLFQHGVHYVGTDLQKLSEHVKNITKNNIRISEKQKYSFPAPVYRWDYREVDRAEIATKHILIGLYHLYGCDLSSQISLDWNPIYNMWKIVIAENVSIRSDSYRVEQFKKIVDTTSLLFPDIKVNVYNFTNPTSSRMDFHLKV